MVQQIMFVVLFYYPVSAVLFKRASRTCFVVLPSATFIQIYINAAFIDQV